MKQLAELLTVGDVARLADRTPETVRHAIDAGRLTALRTRRGWRLVTATAAETFAAQARERDARIAKGHGAE